MHFVVDVVSRLHTPLAVRAVFRRHPRAAAPPSGSRRPIVVTAAAAAGARDTAARAAAAARGGRRRVAFGASIATAGRLIGRLASLLSTYACEKVRSSSKEKSVAIGASLVARHHAPKPVEVELALERCHAVMTEEAWQHLSAHVVRVVDGEAIAIRLPRHDARVGVFEQVVELHRERVVIRLNIVAHH